MDHAEIRIPMPGEQYEHYQGGRYEVLTVGRRYDRRDEIMVAAREHTGHVWVMPIGEWCECLDVDDTPDLLAFEDARRTKRVPRFALCADSPPGADATPLSPEEAAELDRELVLTLEADNADRQRCQHLRRAKPGPTFATVRIATMPDPEGTMQWDYRLAIELCAFCASYAVGRVVNELQEEPTLCASGDRKSVAR